MDLGWNFSSRLSRERLEKQAPRSRVELFPARAPTKKSSLSSSAAWQHSHNGPLFSKHPRGEAFRGREAGLVAAQAVPPGRTAAPRPSPPSEAGHSPPRGAPRSPAPRGTVNVQLHGQGWASRLLSDAAPDPLPQGSRSRSLRCWSRAAPGHCPALGLPWAKGSVAAPLVGRWRGVMVWGDGTGRWCGVMVWGDGTG